MAEIVFGLGTSHSTQCSITPDWWQAQGEFDRGRTPFEELVARAPPELAGELTMEVWQRKYDAVQESIARLTRALAEARLDALIVLGDDQHELFLDDCMPMFSVFWGEQIWDLPGSSENLSPSHRAGRWAVHGDEPEAYPVHAALARALVDGLVARSFDIAQFTRQPEGRSLGHAWTFIRRRLMQADRLVPMVPVMLNTYYPPNQPSAPRCHDLGRALRQAVERWPGDARVGVAASGGLSHFVVDEALDRRVIDGIRKRDAASLRTIPADLLQSGSSEILNWIAAAGAMEHLDMELVQYVPGYRSAAGTGCGMAFALWR